MSFWNYFPREWTDANSSCSAHLEWKVWQSMRWFMIHSSLFSSSKTQNFYSSASPDYHCYHATEHSAYSIFSATAGFPCVGREQYLMKALFYQDRWTLFSSCGIPGNPRSIFYFITYEPSPKKVCLMLQWAWSYSDSHFLQLLAASPVSGVSPGLSRPAR